MSSGYHSVLPELSVYYYLLRTSNTVQVVLANAVIFEMKLSASDIPMSPKCSRIGSLLAPIKGKIRMHVREDQKNDSC